MEYIIKLASESDYIACAGVIRTAFLTVAQEFNISKENAPTNPAFIEPRHLLRMQEKGIRLFELIKEERPVGFVALERLSETEYCMERLAVLSECRHLGLGRILVNYIVDLVRLEEGKCLKIGIIDENTQLKNWYLDYGFIQTGIRKFDHLPFAVCYMELLVKD